MGSELPGMRVQLSHPNPWHCMLRVAMAGGREMIKAAFDEAKVNKQAGNCAGLYLLGDDSVEPAWRGRRGRAPHQTAGQRQA